MLSIEYASRPVLLLVDETYNMDDEAKNIIHTCSQFMDSFVQNTMIHAIVTSLVGTPFAHLKATGSLRPIQYVKASLLAPDTLVKNIFFDDIATFAKHGGSDEAEFLTLVVDTMGLPRLVRFLHNACNNHRGKLASIRKSFEDSITKNFKNVDRYKSDVIKAILSQRKPLGEDLWDNPVVQNGSSKVSWNQLQHYGYIKIEDDGVYTSQRILLKMIGDSIENKEDEDSVAIRDILNEAKKIGINYTAKFFEKLFYLNEMALGLCLNGQTLSYQNYFNLQDNARISSNLKSCKIPILPVLLDKEQANFFATG